jgi:hypothetical protein
LKVSETLFGPAGECLGLIEQDLSAGIVKFRPRDEHPKLARLQWRRMVDCRRDVLEYFSRPARRPSRPKK